MNTKISERLTLDAASMTPAEDFLGVIDFSAGINGSKKITINNLFIGWGMTPAGAALCKAATLASQKAILGLAGIIKFADYQAVAGDNLYCDTTLIPFAVTLPLNPSVMDSVKIMDAKKTFGENNLTVNINDTLLEGIEANYICDINGASVKFVFIGGATGWTAYPNIL